MGASRTKRIMPMQLEILVSFMEMHPGIAQGKCDDLPIEKKKALWLELHLKLNSVEGCPSKTLDQWKKTWTDQKAKTQGKAAKQVLTYGDGAKLSRIEERILKIIALSNKVTLANAQNTETPHPDVATNLPTILQNGTRSLENREFTDTLLSESSGTSVLETPSKAAESLLETMPINHIPSSNPQLGMILPHPTTITLTSLDIPTLIKQEPPDELEHAEETTPLNDFLPPTSTSNSLLNMIEESSKNNAQKGKKRQRLRFRSKYMTAEKAAESFVNIAERNCIVLERIATAMEAQAAEATKQTQLMQDLIDVLRNNR